MFVFNLKMIKGYFFCVKYEYLYPKIMSEFEKVVFGNKIFSNMLEEIYNNQKKKEKQVSTLINELKPMIEDVGDATLLVPLIKEYLEIGVKNDDLLIKMAALAQRALQTEGTEEGFGISDEEKAQLLAELEKFQDKDGN